MWQALSKACLKIGLVKVLLITGFFLIQVVCLPSVAEAKYVDKSGELDFGNDKGSSGAVIAAVAVGAVIIGVLIYKAKKKKSASLSSTPRSVKSTEKYTSNATHLDAKKEMPAKGFAARHLEITDKGVVFNF